MATCKHNTQINLNFVKSTNLVLNWILRNNYFYFSLVDDELTLSDRLLAAVICGAAKRTSWVTINYAYA